MKKNLLLLLTLMIWIPTVLWGQHGAGEFPHERVDWFQKHKIYPEPVFLANKFSHEAAQRFRDKLYAIQPGSKLENSAWKGIFGDELMELGVSNFIWKPGVGYVSFYIYTCHPELRSIDFGTVLENEESLVLNSEFDDSRKTLVKVSWGRTQFLVDERSIYAFGEKIAGIYVEPGDEEGFSPISWRNFWTRGDVFKLDGVPRFPKSYQDAFKTPIKVVITSVGEKRPVQDFQMGNSWYTGNLYPVDIGSGARSGVREGMIFEVERSSDFVIITSVKPSMSSGFVVRSIGADDAREICFYEGLNGKEVPCPNLRRGMKAKTPIGVITH
jgi:hypothetical protein